MNSRYREETHLRAVTCIWEKNQRTKLAVLTKRFTLPAQAVFKLTWLPCTVQGAKKKKRLNLSSQLQLLRNTYPIHLWPNGWHYPKTSQPTATRSTMGRSTHLDVLDSELVCGSSGGGHVVLLHKTCMRECIRHGFHDQGLSCWWAFRERVCLPQGIAGSTHKFARCTCSHAGWWRRFGCLLHAIHVWGASVWNEERNQDQSLCQSARKSVGKKKPMVTLLFTVLRFSVAAGALSATYRTHS